jgi:hypothetical protein
MKTIRDLQSTSVRSRATLASTVVILTLIFVMAVLPAMNRSAGAEVPKWTPNSSVAVPEFPIARNWRRYLEFIPTLEQDRLLYTATQAGIARCMADAGYQYSPGRYIDDRWMDEFNPLNSEWASQFGYHVPTVEEEQPSNTGEGQPAGFAEKLEGDCAKEGWAKTYNAETVSQYVALVDEVLNAPSGIMTTIDRAGDSAVIKSTGVWSQCMAQKGVKASRPDDLLNKYSGKASISDEEIRIRSLDITCDKEARLTQTRSAAEKSALDQRLSSNSLAIEQLAVLRTEFNNYVSSLQ